LNKNSVLAIVVTYGDRWNLLENCITSALNEGIEKVIVVDNNSKNDIEKLCKTHFLDKVVVITNNINFGSAGGYKIGMEKAITSEQEYIFLLDDDNKVIPGTIKKLKECYENLISHYKSDQDLFVLSAYRPIHEPNIASGLKILNLYSKKQCFLGFHIFDLPIKVLRRLPFLKTIFYSSKPDKYVLLDKAVWSGLLFHKSLIQNVGLPIADFILYSDDVEFTQRIISRGGKIVLVTEAPLEEMDKSWNVGNETNNSFDNYLVSDSDFRIFYWARNQTYIENHIMKSGVVWHLNKYIYLGLLLIRALMIKKLNRWKLFCRAVRDGEKGKLGINSSFPLE
jgi:GT2 family glycosyltransferase